MKKQNHLANVAIILGILITGFVLTNLMPDSKRRNAHVVQTNKVDERAILKNTFKQYFEPMATDDWWMVHTPPPNSEAARSLSAAMLNVSNTLVSARSTSPLTEEIFQNFNRFYTSIYERGVSRVTVEGTVSMEDLNGKTEVCFFPRNDYRTGVFADLLHYRSDWKAVMMAGVRWEGPLFGGVLYHELYHGLQHRKGVLGSPPSEANFRAEVEAHELEITVIDYLSKGSYRRAVKAVQDKYPQVTNPRTLLASITTNDLQLLDASIGLEKAGHSIRGTSVAQHVLTLGFLLIDKQGGGQAEKIVLYRWMREI